MKIVIDENMPLADEFFGGLDSVIRKPGRLITTADLQGADALLVRSVTKVDQALLGGSSVRFVGSATIGVDHLDRDYLNSHNISWASAPGCNADAVVNYVLTCLLELEEKKKVDLSSATVGIVGLGNVGGRLKLTLEAMGVSVVACDPLLEELQHQQVGESASFNTLKEVLQADVISLHVPMVTSGKYPTFHLFDYERLTALKKNAVVINTSRGSVVDNKALLDVLEERSDLSIVLDVWENEPTPNPELVRAIDIATPHIAGYSYDGKVKGTEMVYQALCRFLGQSPTITLSEVIGRQFDQVLDPMKLTDGSNITALSLVRACYSVMFDDEGLRGMLKQPASQHAVAFDQMRKNYRLRREFSTVEVKHADWLASTLNDDELTTVRALGFRC